MRIWVVQCSLVVASSHWVHAIGVDWESKQVSTQAIHRRLLTDTWECSADGWTTEWQPALTIDGGTGLPVGEPICVGSHVG